MKQRYGLGESRTARTGRYGFALVLAGLCLPAATPWLNAQSDPATGLPPIPKFAPEQPRGYGPATAGGNALQQFVPTGPPPKIEQPQAAAPRKVKPQAAPLPAPTESAYNPQFGVPLYRPDASRGRPGVYSMPTQNGGQLEQFVPDERETRKFQRQQAEAAAAAQQQAMAAQQQQAPAAPRAAYEDDATRKQREFYERFPMPSFKENGPSYPGPYNPYGPQTAGGNTLQQFVPSGKVRPVQIDTSAPVVMNTPSPQELARQAEQERIASSKYYEAKLTLPMPTYQAKPQHTGSFYGQGALVTAGGSPLQHYNVPPPANPKVITSEPAPLPVEPSAASRRQQRQAERAATETTAASAQSQSAQTLPIPKFEDTQKPPAGSYYGGPTSASGRPLQPFQPGKR